MSKATKFSDVISKMMEAVTLDNKGNMKVLDEAAMAEADELLNSMVVETARDWWAQLESAEDSLADMSDEISFSELNGDPSHVGAPALDVDMDDGDAPASLESMLEGKEFDLESIFEMADEEVDEGMHYEDDDEFGPEDGDDEFDDLMRGDDDDGLGDDGVDGDLDIDDDDDMDAIGGDDDFDMGDDLGDDLGGDFDFDFLDDEGGDFGDDDFSDDDFGDDDGLDGDMDEMNHPDGVRESDEDEDEDEEKGED